MQKILRQHLKIKITNGSQYVEPGLQNWENQSKTN